MNKFKVTLMSAVAVAGLCSNGAQAAGVIFPAGEIDGNGASSVAIIVAASGNCLGNATNQPYGNGADGSTVSVPPFNYAPTSPTAANPAFDCATQNVQPNIDHRYISTGSGGGKNSWRNFNTAGITSNAFGTWTNIQYAFSDSGIVASDLSTYNTNAKGTNTGTTAAPLWDKGGPAIQIPLYVLPIAVAYAPVYGKKDTGATPLDLSFNVKSTFVQKSGTLVTGGLRMSRATMCKIFNGQVTNWNDNALKIDNGGQSLMDPNDDTTRWNSTGVPIKLVGRLDNSGTTNVFSRHLSAVCPVTDWSGLGGNDALPAARISTAVYDTTTGALTSGSEVSGKFGRVPLSSGISNVLTQPIPTPGAGATTLGGYLGYVGADYVAPSTLANDLVYSAALQQNGSGTLYKMPTAANATAAFGKTFLPPESGSTGKYAPGVSNGVASGNRNDPLAWVLPPNAATGLAAPQTGYPIVGTTNMLLYTCYSTKAKREAIEAYVGLALGKFTTTSTGAKVSVNLLKGTALVNGRPIGLLPAQGIANLPTAWATAIWETFFTKTTTGNNPGALNLYINTAFPTTAATLGTSNGNPTCAAGTGA